MTRERFPTPRSEDSQCAGGHRGKDDTLYGAICRPKRWPTPKSSPSGPDFARANREGSGGDDLATAVERERETWPTPQARDHRSGCVSEETATKNSRPLNEAVAPGQLNPSWVEWLMDWPIDWTSLEPMSLEAFEEWKRQTLAGEWFEAEPEGVPRVATGVKNRVARLKAIGNGQVPACAAMAWEILKGED